MPSFGVLRTVQEKMMTLSKALFLKDTSPESLFISDGEIEFHLTCHKHPVSWPQNKVNNLAGNCCMPSKQAVKQLCTKSREPAGQRWGTEQYLLLMRHAELQQHGPKLGEEWRNGGVLFLLSILRNSSSSTWTTMGNTMGQQLSLITFLTANGQYVMVQFGQKMKGF